MADRIKLTEEILLQFGTLPLELHDEGVTRSMAMSRMEQYERIKHQILDDVKKAEKWDEVDKLVNVEGKTWNIIIKENKQLKEELEMRTVSGTNSVFEANQKLSKENTNLKEKLEKIKK